MKTRLALIPAAVITALGLSLTGQNAEASTSDELTHKAHKIEDLAKELKAEFRKHYAHLGTFRHLMGDLSELSAKADHIHGLTHDPRGSLRHLQADVRELDRIAHHLHEVVDLSERSAPGHSHGNTRHVHELLAVLDNTIHRLQLTVASISAPACVTPNRGYRGGPGYSSVSVSGRFSGGHRH